MKSQQEFWVQEIPRPMPKIYIEGLFTEIQAKVNTQIQQMDKSTLRSHLFTLNSSGYKRITLNEALYNIVFATEYILLLKDELLNKNKPVNWTKGLHIAENTLNKSSAIFTEHFEDKKLLSR